MAIVVHQDAVIADAVCAPAPVRVGLLGLGNVGSAVARLSRDAAPALAVRGFAPIIEGALVRSARPGRPASDAVLDLTEHPDVFFSHQLDVVIEVLGGVEPARTLVRRALDRGIPVVTANKSLVAAHGHELAAFARRRRVEVARQPGGHEAVDARLAHEHVDARARQLAGLAAVRVAPAQVVQPGVATPAFSVTSVNVPSWLFLYSVHLP